MKTDIRHRDGLARSGTLMDKERTILFPAVIDTDTLFPSLRPMKYTNVPLSADPVFVAAHLKQTGSQPVTIHPALDNPAESKDCVMVANWHTALPNPRQYVNWLVALKEKTPPDTLWYAPACALPSNAHILCYSGFDLFDYRAVDLSTAQKIFCTAEGEFPVPAIKGAGCGCEGCRTGSLKDHNRNALERELVTIRMFITHGQVRELVEARSRFHAPHVAIMRHLDNRYEFMEQSVPVVRNSTLRANSGESFN